MIRMLRSALAMLLALSMLSMPLVGCKKKDPYPDGITPEGSFLKTENYMPAEVFAQMKTYFESEEMGFSPCNDSVNAPLVSTDVLVLSDCRVKSITIPVYKTGTADENGDFTFSLYILPNAWSVLRTKMTNPDKHIVIKINAKEHALTENANSVRKFIKVDLSEYDITLDEDETLGFTHVDDTLIPARVETYGVVSGGKAAPAKYMIDAWDVVGYYYYDTSVEKETKKEKGFSHNGNSLLFDFELQRTYESEDAYNAQLAAKAQADAEYAAKLAAVKAAYGDKCFSLIGDSISTFDGVSNDHTVHPSLALNAVAYTKSSTLYNYTKTYWGKLSVDTGMDLCVINAWSGGRAYGKEFASPSKNYMDNMLTRSYNLSTAEGKNPDNVVANAPHTAVEVASDEWAHPYSRTLAAFPLEWVKNSKVWAYVTKIDGGYGDRNLVCTCEELY